MCSAERATCPIAASVLDAWLDGDVGRWAEHARSCASCAAAVSGYERLSACVRGVPTPSPPPGASEAVLRALPSSSAHAWVATRILVPLAVACILAVAFGSWALVAGAKGSIVGGVHCQVSRQPLRDAWVVLLRNGKVAAITGTQEMGGGFRFAELRPGSYELLAFRTGTAVPAPAPVTVGPRRTAPLPLWLKPEPSGTRGAGSQAVTGRVSEDATGRSVADALVTIHLAGTVRGVALTDGSGGYSVRATGTGRCILTVYAIGRPPLQRETALQASDQITRADVQIPAP